MASIVRPSSLQGQIGDSKAVNPPLRDLPAMLWLGLPAAIILFRLLTPLLGYERWEFWTTSEYGALELFTVCLLIPAVVCAIAIMRHRAALPQWVAPLMALGGLAVFYFLGEEISWGQHYLGYATPESIAAINEQGEFNLHNLGINIFDNIPRQMMFIATIIGGVILPLTLHSRLHQFGAAATPLYWIIPNYRLVPIALLAVLSNVPEKIAKATMEQPPTGTYWSMALIEEAGELKELAFAGVMLLFLLSVLLRVRSLPADAEW